MTWRTEDGGPARLQSVPGGWVSSREAGCARRPGSLRWRPWSSATGNVSSCCATRPATARSAASSPSTPNPWMSAQARPSWRAVRSGRAASGLTTPDPSTWSSGTHPPARSGPASRCLSAAAGERPYNSFVRLSDGTLVTKDFSGSRPAVSVSPEACEPCEWSPSIRSPWTWWLCWSCPRPPSHGSQPTAASCTWSGTPACSGCAGMAVSSAAKGRWSRRIESWMVRPMDGTACWH